MTLHDIAISLYIISTQFRNFSIKCPPKLWSTYSPEEPNHFIFAYPKFDQIRVNKLHRHKIFDQSNLLKILKSKDERMLADSKSICRYIITNKTTSKDNY